jgi:hypothetical protein
MAKRKKAGGRAPTPQPPPYTPPAIAPQTAGSYDVNYTPSVQGQLTQPYLDTMMGGAYGNMPNVFQNMGGQQQYAGMYGGAGAQQLGSFMQGNPREQGLTGQTGGQASGTLGAYGQIMDPNVAIMQQYQQELRDIQAGKADFDPFLTQQFNQQEQGLRDSLRQQLGPDYATSTAGANALAQFNQNKTTSLGSAQFQRSLQLQDALQSGQQNLANQAGGFANIYGGQRGQQYNQALQSGQTFGQFANDIYNTTTGLGSGALTGQGQYLGNQANLMGLTSQVPTMMGQFGGAMSGQAGNAVSAQGPYQQDRFGQFQASTYPTSGQFMGQMMGQSGNRWVDVGGNIGSMGGGAASAGSKAGG